MRRVLIAIDGSPCSLRAVEHAAKEFSGAPDLHITLFHVLPYVPAEFWDNGHVLTGEEKDAREHVVDRWLSNQVLKLEPIFREAIGILTAHGISQQLITVKSVSDSTDTAGSILEEAAAGGYLVLVMGRCGRSQTERLLLGSVTNKVIDKGAGIAVSVVE